MVAVMSERFSLKSFPAERSRSKKEGEGGGGGGGAAKTNCAESVKQSKPKTGVFENFQTCLCFMIEFSVVLLRSNTATGGFRYRPECCGSFIIPRGGGGKEGQGGV